MKNFLPVAGVILSGLLLAVPSAVASQDSLVTAVFSSVSNGYVREKLPDGSFKREYYALAKGDYVPGVTRDRSIEDVPFPAIAGLVARHLAGRNYFMAENAKSADLLLVITWGTTTPFNDGVYRNGIDGTFAAMNQAKLTAQANPGTSGVDGIQSPEAAVANAAGSELEGQLLQLQMFEGMRQKADEHNANLLGYLHEINNRNTTARFAGGGAAYDDLIADIETERYYLIVSAYDFRAATQGGKRKLLWATRVSIQAQGNRFNQSMAAMLASAARHFGQNSGGLLRQYQEGVVKLGDLKFLGVVPESTSPEKPVEQK